MNSINRIFTLYSLVVLVIIIERLLPYTRGIVQPYDSVQVHQLVQTLLFIPATVVLFFFTMKIITYNFQALKEKSNMLLALLFVIGVYFYGAGEGWHEVANFTLHRYCNEHQLLTNLCGGLFINSYYTGNIIFFIGGVLINVSLLALAKKLPTKSFTRKELVILFCNSIVYALTWFAYAAFDTVSVGLFFSAVLMLISGFFFLKIRHKWKSYPFILYSVLAYTLASLATFIIRIF